MKKNSIARSILKILFPISLCPLVVLIDLSRNNGEDWIWILAVILISILGSLILFWNQIIWVTGFLVRVFKNLNLRIKTAGKVLADASKPVRVAFAIVITVILIGVCLGSWSMVVWIEEIWPKPSIGMEVGAQEVVDQNNEFSWSGTFLLLGVMITIATIAAWMQERARRKDEEDARDKEMKKPQKEEQETKK